MHVGNEAGKGCFCLELTGSRISSEDWRLFGRRWTGGSCRALAFLGTQVLAATHQAGVIRLEDSTRPESPWNAPGVDSGLPLRDVERIYHPVSALAASPEGRIFLAGGPEGIYRSLSGEQRFEACSKREFTERVTLPQSWLFCSGQHEIVVEQE